MKELVLPAKIRIDIRETLKLPVFYFLMYGSFAAWQSFFNVHLDRIGYSSMQIGTLNAVFISTSAVVVPFWGMIADRFGNNRILLLLTTLCAILVFLLGQTILFPWMMMLIAMISLFHSPSSAVMDGMTMGFVRNRKGYSYGQFRLWGSAGYAVASLVVGFFARRDTGLIFNISALMFMLLSIFNLLSLPPNPVTNRGLVSFKSFAIFFRNRQLLIFLLLIFAYGIAVSPLHQFINLYYKDIGAGNALLGLAFFIQAGFEMPTFLIGVWLAKRAKPEMIILFSIFISMIRMILYGFITVPELAIPVSLLHGITIAFFLVGVVEYVQLRTPDHLRTTGQALIYAFHFGAGVTFGNLLLGYLRDSIGMLNAMHLHAGLALLILIAGALFFEVRLSSSWRK
ncbi:MAG: MFS transporter [Bacteroidales bacterium]|nr:MFS transporter [Bacteroidales bacterium]